METTQDPPITRIPFHGFPPYSGPDSTQLRLPDIAVDDFLCEADSALFETVIEDLLGVSQRQFSDLPRFSNPIVFYGPTGSGKTHLAIGVTNVLHYRSPNLTGLALSGTDWARDFATAVEHDRISQWRDNLRSNKYFVLDGTAELLKKYAAQRELACLLDDLIGVSIPCVITCRTNPIAASELIPSLSSRLAAGVTVPMPIPGRYVRKALVDDFTACHQLQLTPEAADWIAKSVNGSVTDVKSSLLRLVPQEQPINLAVAKRLLRSPNDTESISMDVIITAVARYFQIPKGKLTGPTRKSTVSRARGIAIYLARELSNSTFKQIAKALNRKDHTTILHAYRKTIARIDEDIAVREDVENLNLALSRYRVAPTTRGNTN